MYNCSVVSSVSVYSLSSCLMTWLIDKKLLLLSSIYSTTFTMILSCVYLVCVYLLNCLFACLHLFVLACACFFLLSSIVSSTIIITPNARHKTAVLIGLLCRYVITLIVAMYSIYNMLVRVTPNNAKPFINFIIFLILIFFSLLPLYNTFFYR